MYLDSKYLKIDRGAHFAPDPIEKLAALPCPLAGFKEKAFGKKHRRVR